MSEELELNQSTRDRQQDEIEQYAHFYDETCKTAHKLFQQDQIFNVAIIDYLQLWNTNKQIERLLKTKVLGKNAEGLSAIEPIQYKKRFINFAKTFVFKH